MTEEPKQEGTPPQETEQEDTRGKGLFRENPTLVLSLLYIDLTGIGLIYSWVFYRNFGISIFDFAELGDFLLAAFRAPFVTFFVLLVQALLVIFSRRILGAWILSVFVGRFVTPLLETQIDKMALQLPPESLEEIADGASTDALSGDALTAGLKSVRAEFRRRLYLLISVLAVGIFLLVVTTLIPLQIASLQANAIKQGEHARVTVQYRSFAGSAGEVSKSGLELIGATQKVAFFYDVPGNRTLVIPQSQIVSINIPSPTPV